MNIRKAFKLMSFAALGILMSCSGEDMPGNITGGNPDDIMTQEIKFYISGGNQPGDIRTRVAPPGSEGGLDNTIIPCSCQVDRIRLLTFRRVEGSDDSFVYDAKNSTNGSNDIKADKGEFTAEDGTLIKEGRVSEAHTITKEKGYEYRVIAIGYNTQRKAMNHKSTHGNNGNNSFEKSTINESSLFKIVDKVELQADYVDNPIPAENELKNGISRFEDVSLQLVPLSFENEAGYITTEHRPFLSWNSTKKNLTGWYQITPEIFYGSCRSKGSDSEIIKFSDENEITGYLYRGVARLTAKVTNISDLPSRGLATNHVCAIALLADSVRQAVRLSDYENFRTPYFHHDNLPTHNLAGFGFYSEDRPIHTFTAIDIDGWVGDPDTKEISDLGTGECHNYREGEENSYTFETFLLPTQTRLYLRYAGGREGKIINVHDTETNYGDYLLVVNNKSDGNQATGIIDPVAGGEFVYFRRNYQYTLKVDCSIINNWDELRVK